MFQFFENILVIGFNELNPYQVCGGELLWRGEQQSNHNKELVMRRFGCLQEYH